MGLQAHQEILGHQDLKVELAQRDPLDKLVPQDLLARLDLMVLREQPEILDHLDHQEIQALRVLPDHLVHLAAQDLQDLQVPVVHKDCPVQ